MGKKCSTKPDGSEIFVAASPGMTDDPAPAQIIEDAPLRPLSALLEEMLKRYAVQLVGVFCPPRGGGVSAPEMLGSQDGGRQCGGGAQRPPPGAEVPDGVRPFAGACAASARAGRQAAVVLLGVGAALRAPLRAARGCVAVPVT